MCMGFTDNLSGEDSFKMMLLDDYLFKCNPNYLENVMDSARQILDRVVELGKAGKFDSVEAIQLTRQYDGIKQYYLAQFI